MLSLWGHACCCCYCWCCAVSSGALVLSWMVCTIAKTQTTLTGREAGPNSGPKDTPSVARPRNRNTKTAACRYLALDATGQTTRSAGRSASTLHGDRFACQPNLTHVHPTQRASDNALEGQVRVGRLSDQTRDVATTTIYWPRSGQSIFHSDVLHRLGYASKLGTSHPYHTNPKRNIGRPKSRTLLYSGVQCSARRGRAEWLPLCSLTRRHLHIAVCVQHELCRVHAVGCIKGLRWGGQDAAQC